MANPLQKSLDHPSPTRIVTLSEERNFETFHNIVGHVEVAEIRADLFPSLEHDYLAERVNYVAKHMPVLFTLRSEKEGGRFNGSDGQRIEITERILPLVSGVDVEIEGSYDATHGITKKSHDLGVVVLGSYHSLESDWIQNYDLLNALIINWQQMSDNIGVDYKKFALTISNNSHYQNVNSHYQNMFKLLQEHPELILMAMGDKKANPEEQQESAVLAKRFRVLAATLGVPAIFVSPTSDSLVPGQISIGEAGVLFKTLGYNQRDLDPYDPEEK